MEKDNDKKKLVPNDHGALGEPAERRQEQPDLEVTPGINKATREEGLNEEKSAGDNGAYEGFENPKE